MTEQTTKDAAKGAAKDVPAPQDAPPPDAAAAVEGDGEAEAPPGHPAPTIVPQVLPEAAERPKRAGGRRGKRTLVYDGPADVFTYLPGQPGETKFRPGVPTEIGADDADELLTYPNHRFADAADGSEEGEEQDDGST